MQLHLFGLQAPEDGRCGDPAMGMLHSLLTDNGRDFNVYLEYGPWQANGDGSMAAYVWVVDGDEWNLVDEWMVMTGHALASPEDGQHHEVLVAAEDAAQTSGAGCMWH